MKKPFILLGLLFVCSQFLIAQTSGGPDAFGYTWRDSNDPNGPTYDWLDVQDVGVQVTGLTDDNASSAIPLGLDFHYYWYDVDQVVIGSNGWVSFDNVSNIAHCFPTIPLAGGSANNYLAPFMTDLIMNASGSSAEVYYWHDSGNDRFVISYLNVPWWQQASPGYTGSNSFQIILSNADSSITFQYKTMDQASLADNAGCASDLVIGMENNTGDIGLGLSQFTEVVPNDNYAIKFYAPAEALIDIPDATPLWNQNEGNKGVFVMSGQNFNLQSNIKNVGNAAITGDITVTAELENLSFAQAYSQSEVVSGLAAGASSLLNFSPAANVAPGQYYFNTVLSNGSDINLGNNTQVTEVNAVNIDQSDVVLSYATQNPPDGNVGWTGGGGMGVYMEPPVYSATLNSVDVWVTSGINGASDFTIEVLAPDGPDGVPGTVLETVVVTASSYVPDTWVNVPLSNPVEVTSGGIHIAFIHPADGVFLGTEVTGPLSRRTYEFVGGSWAVYRENTAAEMLINGHFAFSTSTGINEQFNDHDLSVVPNPNNGQFDLLSVQTLGKANVEVFDATGRLIFEDSFSGNRFPIDLNERSSGVYFVRVLDGTNVSTMRMMVQ